MRPVFLTVAGWEFRRFFKAKEILWGVAIVLAIFLGQKVVADRIVAERQEEIAVAVLGGGPPVETEDAADRFRFEPVDRNESVLKEAVRKKEYDALLVPAGPDSARLVVRKRAPWQDELRARLTAGARAQRLEDSGIPVEILAGLSAPFVLDTEILSGPREDTDASRWSVAILVGLMLIGVLLGNSYLFIAITGEKTQRITEQILTAIRPQDWIDGKILGLALLALVHVLSYVVAYMLYRAACVVIWKEGLGLPPLLDDPLTFLTCLVLILLGFYFWFCFYGLVASTISDPNNSSRSSLLMLPFVPLGVAFVGLQHPDAFWMKLLGLLPVSSPTVLPVRMVLGETAWWEIPLALVLLAAGIWALRRAAGIVFGLGMLMFGKEPGPREMWRWLREGWDDRKGTP